MATRAIKRKRDPGPGGPNWAPPPERAPSIIRADRAIIFRMLGMVGLVFTAVGTLAMVAPSWKMNYMIGPEWGFFWFTIGVGLLLFHAISDSEIQYRRTYAALGLVLLFAGIAARVLPAGEAGMGGGFLPFGIPALILALAFLLAVLRHESDIFWRSMILRVIGLAGAAMVVAAFWFGSASSNFLRGEGILLAVLGLFYVTAFIAMQEPGSKIAFRAGLALGVIGGLEFLLALFRSLRPWLFDLPASESYMVPDGLVMMAIGLVYMAVSLGICSDWPVIVMTRRELAAFFYSPIAYLVILGLVLVGWYMFASFVGNLLREGQAMEPIVARYILHFIPVICLIFVVPVITMRLLSEEKRSGTMEVLLTAPVSETAVVLSKYFAAFIFYTLALAPWWLYLIGLRVFGGQPFDYRPMLSFFIALSCSGAGFLALGLFFSSLTKNQIISAVLTFATILGLTVVFWWGMETATSPWREIFTYISYLDLWISALEGQFAPRFLLFHVSVAIFFVFLTIKVLEARKWT